MRRLHSQLTFANVTAVIALFVALGGGAYAATSLPKNSVGAKQIKANAVTSAKIKNGAVTAAKIAPGSIGTVATADNANHATTADSATRAGSAETATRAASAETANRSATAETATRATTSDTATHADSATSADHATSANSATSADHATSAATAAVATDANTLDGLSSDSFAPVTNFLSGAADVSVTSSQLLFAVPDGPELLTTGTGANDFNIRFRNPLTSTESWTLSSVLSRLSEVPPGGFGGFTLTGNVATITLYSESMKRSVTAVCTDLPEVTQIGCAGTLYEAGA
jgi:hypothetical protein